MSRDLQVGLVPTSASSTADETQLSEQGRFLALEILVSSLQYGYDNFRSLIMSKQRYLDDRILDDFVILLAEEEYRLEAARLELDDFKSNTTWDSNQSTPIQSRHSRDRGRDLLAIHLPPAANIHQLKFDEETIIHQELDSSPALSLFISVPVPQTTQIAPARPTLSRFRFEPEYRRYSDEVIELSAQERAVSNFQTRPITFPVEETRRNSISLSTPRKPKPGTINNVKNRTRRTTVSFVRPLITNLGSSFARRQRVGSAPPSPSPPLSQPEITPEVTITAPTTPQTPPENPGLLSRNDLSPIKNNYSENPRQETWLIPKTWLSLSSQPSMSRILGPEMLFLEDKYQDGLVAIDIALSTPTPSFSTLSSSLELFSIPDTDRGYDGDRDSTPASTPPTTSHSPVAFFGSSTASATIAKVELINLHLLRSCALLASDQPSRALHSADIALGFAEDHEIYYMICKSHLYRGLALMKLERWREASLDFTRAANIRGWALKVRKLKEEAERMAAGGVMRDVEDEKADVEAEVEERNSSAMRITKSRDNQKEPEILGRDILWGVWPGDEK